MKSFALTLCVGTILLCIAVTLGANFPRKSKSAPRKQLTDPKRKRSSITLSDNAKGTESSSISEIGNPFDIPNKMKIKGKRRRSRKRARKRAKKNSRKREIADKFSRELDVETTSVLTSTSKPSTDPPHLVNWLPGVANRPCGECIWQDCQPVDAMRRHCPSGVIRDQCKCCVECASGVGMPCYLNDFAPMWLPPCGDDLVCVPFEREQPMNIDLDEWGGQHKMEGYCSCSSKGPVCGSNNITYENICEFRELAARTVSNSLTMSHPGPCTTEPKLNFGPNDIVASIGDIVSFRCEATGFPLPRMQWIKMRSENKDDDLAYDLLAYEDSTEIELPGHMRNAVTQVRGGPAKYQITTWLTLDKVKASDEGEYTCRATNAVGVATDSASLKINEP